jgi:hypothetical protein
MVGSVALVTPVAEKPLYRHNIVLHVPMWLVKGTLDWMLLNDRYLHPVRMESQTYPLKYRIRLGTPAWAVSLFRSVADAANIPKEERRVQIIQHQTMTYIEDQVWIQGETMVDGVALIRSDIELIPTESGETRCDMIGISLQAKYQGLMAGASKHIQAMIVAEQRRLELRVRVVALGILMVLRVSEPHLARRVLGRHLAPRVLGR